MVLRVSAVGLGIAVIMASRLQTGSALAAPPSELAAVQTSVATPTATLSSVAAGIPTIIVRAGPHPPLPPAATTTPDAEGAAAPATPARVVEVSSTRSAPRTPAPTPYVSFSTESTTDSVGLTAEVLPARSAPASLPEAGSLNDTSPTALLATAGALAVALGILLSKVRKSFKPAGTTRSTTLD
ncbi:MAG TPA: hypothetical protein VHS06_09430 [Chloroflexota bacterium]|nr:hypothetical protein [Chloroflexota bacterium]